jgi:hypothetical protein
MKEAEAAYQEALELYRQLAKADPPPTSRMWR